MELITCENCGENYQPLNTHNSPIGRICTLCYDANNPGDWKRLYSADEIDNMEWNIVENNGVITARAK